MSKRIAVFMTAAVFTAAVFVPLSSIRASAAGPYPYQHTYPVPFVGSAAFDGPYGSSSNPYVNPWYNTTKTTYLLRKKGETAAASNYIHTNGPGRVNFVYRAGYGSGGVYEMVSYPAYTQYISYNVVGTWNP